MDLRERLDQDLKSALRNKDSLGLRVIRGIKAAILAQETKGVRIQLDDDGIISVIAREVKERKDAIPEFERAQRQDLVDKLNQEIDRLKAYLPEPLSPEAIDALIQEALSATSAQGAKDMGKMMGYLSPLIKGRADGRLVSERVKECLAQMS